VLKSTAFRDFHWPQLNLNLRKTPYFLYSQKGVLKIKSAKINCFLRFSLIKTQPKCKKNVVFHLAKKRY